VTAPSVLGPLPWPDGEEPPPAATLPELAEHQAQSRAQAPAIVAADARLTYGEFAEEIRRTAAGLASLGVDRGSHVALLAPNSAEWLVIAFAAMRLGAVLESFNTWVRAWDLRHLLTASGAEVLVMSPSVRSVDLLGELRELAPDLWDGATSADFPTLRRLVLLDGEYGATPPPPGAIRFRDLDTSGDVPPIGARADDTAYVLYTSGTTSHPKAVPLRHRSLIENGYAIGSRMGLDDGDRIWLGSPLFWSYGCANAVMAAFGHGSCLVLQERFSARESAELLAREACTAAYLLPSIAGSLAEEAGAQVRAVTSLRSGLIIGTREEVRLAAVDLDIPELCNVYGSTETYGNCCVTPHTMPLEQRLECQGPPLPGVELRAVDPDTGDVTRVGELGEFQVRGRILPEYVGDPAATAAAITPDGWYRTGDTGIVHADGTVQFVGRATDMIKTAGINVSPAEVEGFLSRHPAVLQVGVVGAPHPTRGEVAVAFVVLRPGQQVTADDLAAFCKGSLAGFKVPWAIELVDSVPATTTGKLLRRDLRAPAASLVAARTGSGERHER
jgi:fatty-acyl-CoA synthase